MPKASRNERRKRQVKRTNSLLKRQLRGLSAEANKAYLALITILAQKGGEITVTRGTMQQAANDLLTLGFSVGPGVDEQELIIRLVTNSAVGEAAPPVEEESDVFPTAVEILTDLHSPDTSNNPTLEETFNALIATHDGSTPVADPSVEQD